MKHFIIFQIIFLFAFTSLEGQQYSLGLKPGFLVVGAVSKNDPRHRVNTLGTSYSIGISLNDQINKRFGLKIEPGFTVKGHNYKWGSGSDHIEKKRNQFLSFPFLFYYSVKQNLNIEFGPEICYMLFALTKPDGSNSYSRRHDTWNMKKTEFSLVSGISYTFLKRFDIGARFGYGLTPCEKGIDLWAPYFRLYEYYTEFNLNIRLFTKIKNNTSIEMRNNDSDH